ncbi:hypothetical protein A1Q2_06868 [Trichosporon asahii var. asahii CBS 8904]|uniref:Uncharacterized protein n=1 Tax=Trichosporon asahii var. asahii (strain CBS 8904) TaxID=1220162 RepID=K1VI57_TRIAC|nr:hypothetical protein A1Q2_06868 [Trichosporon asahii var. asahii CBS 8904]
MFGIVDFTTLTAGAALLAGVAAVPSVPLQPAYKWDMIKPDEAKVKQCLSSADWVMEWSGNPINLGNADPVKEFKDLIGSNQCGSVSCHKGTSESLTHKVAGAEDVVDTSYRIEISEAWFNNQAMKDLMTEVVAQGIEGASQWETKHWEHPTRLDFLNGNFGPAGSGDNKEVTLPGDEFTLTWKDIASCSAFRLKVNYIDTRYCGAWTFGTTLTKAFDFGALAGVTDWSQSAAGIDALKSMVQQKVQGNINITTKMQQPKC